ncbi:MAG TPA: PQQ-dependent sugar dehydrogenase [Gaiellaceae bacterium]|nr:PQQ-dependent sugar dehydrogenase [Gaiellaceae bacterium]
MRSGRLAAVSVLLALAASCTGGSGEDVTDIRSTTEPDARTTTQSEAEAPPPDSTTDPLPVGNGRVRLKLVTRGLDSPVFATAAPGEEDRLYVVEQGGRVRILEDGDLLARPFLDISDRVSGGNEQGLLSLVFHPRYASNGLFYVNYTDLGGDTHVVELRAPGTRRAPVEMRELLHVRQPYANHNGGQLAFGPDGLLYVGLGDGGSAGDPENRAQDLSSRLGKLLRLDVDERGARWELVGYGLRNPWRFSFDRVTGDLWLGDVGQQAVEEIDFVRAGGLDGVKNFGWDVFEGSEVYEDKPPTRRGALVGPLTEYSHDVGCSVTGGYVYRGRKLRDEAWGRYFYGDYCSGLVWSLVRLEDEVTNRRHPFRVAGLTSFAEDLAGELYALSREGAVYRLAKAS